MKRRVVLVIPVLAVLLFLFFPGNPEPGFRYYFRVPPGWVTEEDAEYGTVYILPSNRIFPLRNPILVAFSESGMLNSSPVEDFLTGYPESTMDYILNVTVTSANLTLLEVRNETLNDMAVLITKGNRSDSQIRYVSLYFHEDYIISLSIICNLEDCTEYEDDINNLIYSISVEGYT